MKVSRYGLMIGLLLIGVFGFGWHFIHLSERPFGLLFWSQFYLAFLCMLAALGVGAFWVFKRRHRFWGMALSLLVLIGLIGLIELSYDYRLLLFPEAQSELSVPEWQADVDYLIRAVEQRHPPLSTKTSRQFRQQADELRSQLTGWSDQQIKVHLMQLIASLNDGHSIIPPQPAINFHVLPLLTHRFSDGTYIIKASRAWAHLENARVLQIGGADIDLIQHELLNHIGVEHPAHKYDRIPLYLMMTELLYELDYTDHPGRMTITIEKEGRQWSETIDGEPFYQWLWFYFAPQGADNNLPYRTHLLDQNYWYELYDNGVLYVNINNIKNQSGGPSFVDFTQALLQTIEQTSFDKLVLDLRHNRGGDNTLMRDLVAGLRDQPKINQKGRFYVLTSRRTFSAAVNLATMLENQTRAIFVGQPTGQGPNQFGDARQTILPNSGIRVFLSTQYWHGSFEADRREAIMPHHSIEHTFDDYLAQRDPALTLIDSLPLPTQPSTVNDANWSGRYVCDHFVAEIQPDAEGQMWLRVDDGIPNSLRPIHTPLYATDSDSVLATDLRHLRLKQADSEHVILQLATQEMVFQRSDQSTPFEQIQGGEVVAGVAGLDHLTIINDAALERWFNTLGYELLAQDRLPAALAVFQANARLHPHSANAWDSLAEAESMQPNIVVSRQHYQRSLALNPANQNAAEMIQRLSHWREQ